MKETETNNPITPEEPKTLGIGGLFFKSKDPVKMREWFKDNLGLNTNEYGSLFEFRLINNPEQVGSLQWSPMSDKTTYFDPSEKDFMINYRVNDLEKLLIEFKKNGVTVVDTIETYEYGKFLHILDSENNKIELWEPVDKIFAKLYEDTMNKDIGIGGFFFKTKNPNTLKEWYEKNLGIKTDDYGAIFSTRDSHNSNAVNFLQWSAFPDDTKYFEPSEKDFMINYRVKNLEELVTKLKANGVTILDEIEDTDYGKFIHVLAPENNKIELWEPPQLSTYP